MILCLQLSSGLQPQLSTPSPELCSPISLIAFWAVDIEGAEASPGWEALHFKIEISENITDKGFKKNIK